MAASTIGTMLLTTYTTKPDPAIESSQSDGIFPSKGIAFIDPAVEDYQHLVNGVLFGIKPIVLDKHRDGIEQITEILLSVPSENPPTTKPST
jgi:hypothetical protein